MTRKQIQDEIKKTLGVVPTMFNQLPDSTLELEWNLFKVSQVAECPIPNKYRELIGLGIASAIRCPYCTFFHTEMAKLNGATPQEIEDACHVAKSSAGWSTYISGTQIDLNTFKKEIQQIVEYQKAQR